MTLTKNQSAAMTTAYDDAVSTWSDLVERDKKSPRSFGVFHAVGVADSIHGQVLCIISTAEGRTTGMATHFRKNWKLNGKQISSAKLKVALA